MIHIKPISYYTESKSAKAVTWQITDLTNSSVHLVVAKDRITARIKGMKWFRTDRLDVKLFARA